MKITHICLCGTFNDGWTYQENLLTKYHKRLGYDVSVIASKYIRNEKVELELNDRNIYINEHGVKMIRIDNKFNTSNKSKFKIYRNLYKTISKENPDILFIHGLQFLNIIHVAIYLKKHPNVIAFVDNHADLLNSARNWISKNLLHKILWRRCAKIIEPYTEKFYGVLPARVDFLTKMYNISKEKVELLNLGVDDENVRKVQIENRRQSIRVKLNIDENDFLIVTGGKIDRNKPQTMMLMEAVKKINNDNVRLIVFGSVLPEFKERFDSMLGGKVNYIGWLDADEAYHYFNAGDLVVFPGLHSVFWEQVVGLGKPCVFRYMEGFTHIDLGGNCKFLYKDSVKEIEEVLIEIFNNKELYENMKHNAVTKGMKEFSYEKIAQMSIENCGETI